MKKWLALYLKMSWDRKVLMTAAAVSVLPIVAAAVFFRSPLPEEKHDSSRPPLDTYIPKGFVLVPIEVQNYESLDSILGQYGVVDLFQGGSGESKHRLVARNVRLLRAPQNPSHFAVLVAEAEAPEILKYGSAFTVIMKRQESSGTQFVKEQKSIRRSIVYEGDS